MIVAIAEFWTFCPSWTWTSVSKAVPLLYEFIDESSGKESVPVSVPKLSNNIKSILESLNGCRDIMSSQILLEHTGIANRRSHHQPVFEFYGKYLKSFTSFKYSTEIELSKSTISSHCSTSGKIILKLHRVSMILVNMPFLGI